jgi:hypothetical protein
MGRRYVRDKAGRFAAKGGGSKGKGGKMGKSSKNVKARAAYKNQSGKLREAKKMAKGRMTTKREQKYWNQQLGGAKSGMTRVSNRLAGKGKGAAATKAVGTGPKKARGIKKRRGAKVYDNTTNTSIKMKTVKKNLRRKYPQSKAAKSLEKRVAAKTAKKAPRKQKGKMAYDGANKAASEARDRIIAKTKAKNAKKKVKKTAGKYTEKTAKGEYKRASREDRMQGSGATKARKRVIKKQTGKPAYQQRMGTEAGQTRLGRTKAPRAGSKTKAEKIRGKIESKKAANKALRGDEFKGAKKRKPPRTAKGAMAYDGPNKAASEARDRIVAKTKAIRAKKGIKAPSAFGGTSKYARQGKVSKASKGSGAKQKYKKATSELRKSKRGSSLYQQSQMGHSSKRKQGQVTRLTNKFTNKRKAASSLKDLEKKIPKKTKSLASNKIVGFKRKKKR